MVAYMRRPLWLLVAFLVLGLLLWQQDGRPWNEASTPAPPVAGVAAPRADAALPGPDVLPREARDVLDRIARGGPFAYRQDGGVFHNREGRLPPRPRGYYREYTVATPGARDRGPRRIVTGGHPPAEYWYTGDHYRSFMRFQVPR